jgi:ParB-like chromosome segregation protein Spo0J
MTNYPSRSRKTDKQATIESTLRLEEVALDQLKPHPRNYQEHPDDEIEHIMESIKTHGFYRNIVIAQDGTILAGHGVVIAARRLGYTSIPAIRTNYLYDDTDALKLLIGDNEIRHLAEVDDRALTVLLKELREIDDLLGTG